MSDLSAYQPKHDGTNDQNHSEETKKATNNPG
jgi:hypothetical protein